MLGIIITVVVFLRGIYAPSEDDRIMELEREFRWGIRQRNPKGPTTRDEVALELQFNRKDDVGFLQRVCNKYAARITSNLDVPPIETNYIQQRVLWTEPTIFKIEMVRCNNKYALVEAGDIDYTSSVWVLQKTNKIKDVDGAIFNVHSKYYYSPNKPVRFDKEIICTLDDLEDDKSSRIESG